jgi:hypothetical protein
VQLHRLSYTLIGVGIALALRGYDFFDSASSQINRAFSGDRSIEAWLGIIGGVIYAAVGISKVR